MPGLARPSNVTCTPQGAASRRCAISASRRGDGVVARRQRGGSRRARARGTIWFEDSATPGHRCRARRRRAGEQRGPRAARSRSSRTESNTPDSSRNSSSGIGVPSHVNRRRALDRDVAGIVVQGGDHPCERRDRVGDRPAVRAAVLGLGQHADLHDAVGHAADARSDRRDARPVVAAVGDDGDVGAQQVGVSLRRAAGRNSVLHSSSPSTRTLIVTGGSPSASSARIAAAWITMPDLSSAAPRPYSRPSRTTGSNGGVSTRRRSLGLHVVVRVQQTRRRALGAGDLAEDRRVSAVRARAAGRPGARPPAGCRAVASADARTWPGRSPGSPIDGIAHQRLELGDGARHVGRDAGRAASSVAMGERSLPASLRERAGRVASRRPSVAYRNRSCSRNRRPCQNSTVSGRAGTRPRTAVAARPRPEPARRPANRSSSSSRAPSSVALSRRPRAEPRLARPRGEVRVRLLLASRVDRRRSRSPDGRAPSRGTRSAACGFSASWRPLRLS